MYTCPMHPEIRQAGPGNCPKCGMALVPEGATVPAATWTLKDFAPLIVLFALIGLLTGLMVWLHPGSDGLYAMRQFEGFFFLCFAIFKLLNLRGFAEAYATYDLIAKRSTVYAYAYPFIELALGFGYLFNIRTKLVAAVTLVLMLVGMLGVYGELRKKRQIQCACLGVVFKLPMTWVTFLEDGLMAVMALAMLLR